MEFSRFDGWPAVSRTCQLPSYCTDEAGQARKPTASSLRTSGRFAVFEEVSVNERSAPVVTVDRHILLSEVAGPDRCLTFTETDIDFDRNILLFHDIRCGLFRI